MRFSRKRSLQIVLVTCFAAGVFAAPQNGPTRLDLFDKADNKLMFVTFTYDPVTNNNTARTVYMADSTFVRQTTINRSGEGKRESEISYDFKGDTSFVAKYSRKETSATMSLTDRFGIDQIGGGVDYSENSEESVNLIFRNTSEQFGTVVYQRDASANIFRVDMVGKDGKINYYGLFNYDALAIGGKKNALRARNGIKVFPQLAGTFRLALDLAAGSNVKVDLMSLSGRRVQTVFNELIPSGAYLKTIDVRQKQGVASGVYLMTVSVDGVIVTSARYLNQPAGGTR